MPFTEGMVSVISFLQMKLERDEEFLHKHHSGGNLLHKVVLNLFPHTLTIPNLAPNKTLFCTLRYTLADNGKNNFE
jgi:hypothetical protein